MELFIRIQNGEITGHPLLKENLLQAYPDIDLSTTTEFVPFVRVLAPTPGVYDKTPTVSYVLENGVAKDVWTVEPMTPAEKLERQQQVKEQWKETGFNSWIFNEENCSFDPPVPFPSDGKFYNWDESLGNWVLIEDAV